MDTVAESNGEAITHLTAEIESFVRTADTEKEESVNVRLAKIKKNNVTIDESEEEIPEKDETLRQSPESNEYYPYNPTTEITIEKIQNLGEIDANSNERCKKSPVKILIRAPTDEEPTIENDIVVSEATCAEKCPGNTELEYNSVTFKEETTVYPEENISKSSEIGNIKTSKNKTMPTSSIVASIFENDFKKNDTNLIGTELKITESTDDLTKIESQQVAEVDDTPEVIDKKTLPNKLKSEQIISSGKTKTTVFDAQFIPLQLDTPIIRKEMTEFDNKKRKPPTPPQRRRSVKEIIESINKCQKLLKINHDLNTNQSEKEQNCDLFDASSSNLFKNKNSLSDRNIVIADELNNNAKIEDLSNIPLFVEKFNEFNRNTSNVEWNPLPKPRRHRSSIKEIKE